LSIVKRKYPKINTVSYKIEFFETAIPAQYALPAEDLYSNGHIKEHTRSGKSNWTFKLVDEDTYEIQIKSSETTISKTNCTCAIYEKEKACQHVFACFYELRKQIEIDKKAKLEKQKSKTKRPYKKGGIRISDFITNLSETELKEFVRNYASNDKKFSASLKARFARKMINQNNESVYKSILDSIIGPIRIKDQKIGSAELRSFEYVTQELIQQYEDAVSLQQYTEGFFILKAILNKGCYIHHNSKKESEKIMQLIIQIHTFLDELFYCPLAPELREKLYGFSLELAQKSYYKILDNTLNIFEVLYTHKKEDKEYRLINEAAKVKREQLHLDINSSVFLDGFLIRMDWNDKAYNSEAFLKYPLEYQNKVIDLLINLKAIGPAIQVLEDIIQENRNVSRFVKEKLIYTYGLSDKTKSYSDAILKYFINYKNPKYLKVIQTKLGKKWPKTKKEYLKEIAKLEDQKDKDFLKAKLLYETEDHDSLIEIFEAITDLDTAMAVDREIIKMFPDRVIESYFKKSCHVLENYVGSAAAGKIRSLLNHIENVTDRKLRAKLFQQIKNHYVHRPQLIVEIMSMG